ncbi:hypothetical protein DPV78_012717, partial [Talaromyces pinophilus]
SYIPSISSKLDRDIAFNFKLKNLYRKEFSVELTRDAIIVEAYFFKHLLYIIYEDLPLTLENLTIYHTYLIEIQFAILEGLLYLLTKRFIRRCSCLRLEPRLTHNLRYYKHQLIKKYTTIKGELVSLVLFILMSIRTFYSYL